MSNKDFLDSLKGLQDAFKEATDERNAYFEDLLSKISYDDKLAVVEWTMRNIVQHAKEGGTFRYLIYDRLGFGPDAYVPLYLAGGMEISNELNLKGQPDGNTKNESVESAKKEDTKG